MMSKRQFCLRIRRVRQMLQPSRRFSSSGKILNGIAGIFSGKIIARFAVPSIFSVSQGGNAILISLILMASTITISLGITALVSGEVRNIALSPPSERAYYKAESYVEQALWQKKQDANYQKPDVAALLSGLPANDQFLCNASSLMNPSPASCFTQDARSISQTLKSFAATTTQTNADIGLNQDVSQQLDVSPSSPAPGTATFQITKIDKTTASFKGLEVTVIASPLAGSSGNGSYQGAAGSTGVFIEKKLFSVADAAASPSRAKITLGNTAIRNALLEQYPALSDANYRIRLKALGSDATITTSVSSSPPGSSITLRSPDFTAQAVAEDSGTRRGVRVIVPASPQVLGVFDYVLFADQDLNALNAKKPANTAGEQGITALVINDANGNCAADAGETGISGTSVTLNGGSAKLTDSTGQAAFTGLSPGVYAVAIPPAGKAVCPNANQNVTLASGDTSNLNFFVRTARSALYETYNNGAGDHFYTTSSSERDGVASFGYAYSGTITGYLYAAAAGAPAGIAPLYRLYIPSITDHFYTMSAAERDSVVASFGGTYEGITGYLSPYAGAQPAYDGSCPSGSAPLYRSYSNSKGDHYYTMSAATRDAVVAFGWGYEIVAGCMWTTP